jgi:GT2 family glycosyltransferase
MILKVFIKVGVNMKRIKYDLLFFPRMNCDFYIEEENIISHFTEKGHRVFYFNIDITDINEEKNTNKNFIMIALNHSQLNLIKYRLDKLINTNLIKDCVLIVEDPRWQSIIAYLKERYGFKVIFNYSCRHELKDISNPSLFKYDNKILDISDHINLSLPHLDNGLKINNSNISIIDFIHMPEHIESVIKKVYGLVSIIIVTFNNLNFTKQCINSILKKTAYPNYEIVIVDNFSQDETVDYLTNLQKKYMNVTVVLNKKNRGFAKANNIGIRHAKGKYVILLNNDTVVTRGWITGFIKHLDRDKKLGLLGPVTNKGWSESKIPVNYTSIDKMDIFAERYTIQNFNKLCFNINMLEMFCIAMKRKIIDEIGYLDESFEVGMFEDDDYSYRVKLKGYKIAFARDVFIHHHGSASLSKLRSDKFWSIFMKNKEKYEKKWNTTWRQRTTL